MKYAYFPGCSLKGTGRAYERVAADGAPRAGDRDRRSSTDWNCCGATAYMSVDEDQGLHARRRATWRSPRSRGAI